MWISNAPLQISPSFGQKNEEGRIHGLIVERGMEGFTTPETHNKWSLRASSTGELIFDNVKVPKKICYQTNLVWGPHWMLRFSTLRWEI
jgi:glutaryl-CoA dehydrogenase